MIESFPLPRFVVTSITPCAAFAPYTAEAASVATVNSSGLVTGVASGSATIIVTTQDGGRTATSAITVNSASQTPFGGTPWTVPGTIEAENFDNGGEGVAYHDNDAVNSGGQGRAGEGGLNVGWTNTGEWLEYTVNVAAAGTYNIDVRTASTLAGGTFRIEFGGVDKTGTMTTGCVERCHQQLPEHFSFRKSGAEQRNFRWRRIRWKNGYSR